MCSELTKSVLIIDGAEYSVEQLNQVQTPPEVPRLVVVSYLPNRAAQQILQACLTSIQRLTATPYELWVVDNCSPRENLADLIAVPQINLVLNRTTPLPPGRRSAAHRLAYWVLGMDQSAWGSYANAIGLEIAKRSVNPASQFLMTLHMDTVACHPYWLDFLLGKLDRRVKAAGVRLDRYRDPEGILHVLGMLFDYQLVQHLGLDFFPQLPRYDVGDRITVGLRAAGYDIFACANTLTDPDVAQRIPKDSEFAQIGVDRSLDDDGNVIFMHLGRGLRKSSGRQNHGVSAAEWFAFIEAHVTA